MHKRAKLAVVGRALTVGLALASAAMARAAEPDVWPPPGVSYQGDPAAPDISGLWLGQMTGEPGVAFEPNRGPMDGRPGSYLSPFPLPYTPAYQKIYDDRIAAAKKGRALGDTSAQCRPFGLPRMLVSKAYPDEIVQTPGQVTFFMNNTFPVVIWTDGRAHPKDVALSDNGHSIGYWAGDTLYVDTVAIKAETGLTSQRWPHSDQLHLQWTVRRVAPDRLHVSITFYDPAAFTEPVTTTNIWARKTDPKWQILDDASCFENNRETTDAGGAPGFPKF